MFSRVRVARIGFVLGSCLLAGGLVHADTLNGVSSASAQGWNDTLVWSQKGGDGTVLPASFTATTSSSNAVTVGLAAPNSIISVVCSANPCSWITSGLTAGHSLLWTSDAGNGGSGPVSLSYAHSIYGGGAYVQADAPGAYTVEIQAFNGSTQLAAYTLASDSAGDPIYLGVNDQTGPNITKLVFSLNACSGTCTDFAVETVLTKNAASGPAVSFTPGSVSFPNTYVGTTSATQTVTMKNTGTTTLTTSSLSLGGTTPGAFKIASTNCPQSIAPGATCSIGVAFRPGSAGSVSAAVLVADNAPGSPQQIPLSGTGLSGGPTAVFSQSTLTFPNTNVGSTSSSQTLTLRNTGSATLNITSIASNAAAFVITGTNCGSTLTAGSSCNSSVAFKPTTAGTQSASILATDNAPGSPQQVNVSGTGVGAASGLSISPSSISFGNGYLGTTSPSQVVTLKNTGSTTVTLHGISLTGTNPSDFLEINTCASGSLAPGASCAAALSFKPAATGSASATLSITSSASGSAQTVPISGSGNAEPTLSFSATSFSFPATSHGARSEASVLTITNTASSTATLSLITLGGTSPADFLQINTCGTTLTGGSSCSVYLAFQPAAAASYTGSLIVYDNATGGPHSIGLSGTGK